MKNIHFIIFCLLSCAAMAQSPGRLMTSFHVGFDEIIRHDPTTGHHITYSMAPGLGNHFSITDYMTERKIEVACSLLVNDFEIIDDYVFFCGSTVSNSGFLGWFSISKLFTSAGPARVDPNLIVGDMATMDDIEVFLDSEGLYHVAGYGVDYSRTGPDYFYRAFEAVGDPTSVMNYRTLRLGNMFYDQIVDMAVTDNYVTYLGKLVNTSPVSNVSYGRGITFHTFPKYDMFGSLPYPVQYFQTVMFMEINLHIVPANHDPIGLSNPKMVHSKKDQVAVCSYREDVHWWLEPLLSGEMELKSKLRTSFLANRIFDLAPVISGGPISPISVAFADLLDTVEGAINDIVYDYATSRFVVLHNHQSPTAPLDYYVTTLDYSSSIAPTMAESERQFVFSTPGVWVPRSLCLDPSSKYSVMGHGSSPLNHYYWQNDILRAPGGCTTLINLSVATARLEGEKVDWCYNKPTPWILLNFLPSEPKEESNRPINIICN